jgi:hypothetical protein
MAIHVPIIISGLEMSGNMTVVLVVGNLLSSHVLAMILSAGDIVTLEVKKIVKIEKIL